MPAPRAAVPALPCLGASLPTVRQIVRRSNPIKSQSRWRWVSLLVLAVIVLPLVAGCGGQTAAPAAEAPTAEAPAVEVPAAEAPVAEAPAATGPTPGGVLIVGSPQEPETLNPLLSGQSIADALSALSVEGLVEVDAEGKYAPVLVEALPEVPEDGLVVTYQLKPGVTFSNGDPFTCADVVYTWNAVMSDLSQASTSGYSDIDSIDCPDDTTGVVNFAELYAPYLRLFSYILPQAAGDPANLDSVIVKILPSREVGMQLLGIANGLLDVFAPGEAVQATLADTAAAPARQPTPALPPTPEPTAAPTAAPTAPAAATAPVEPTPAAAQATAETGEAPAARETSGNDAPVPVLVVASIVLMIVLTILLGITKRRR